MSGDTGNHTCTSQRTCKIICTGKIWLG